MGIWLQWDFSCSKRSKYISFKNIYFLTSPLYYYGIYSGNMSLDVGSHVVNGFNVYNMYAFDLIIFLPLFSVWIRGNIGTLPPELMVLGALLLL